MWIGRETKWFRKLKELTETSSRVQATSVLTCLAVNGNCAHSFSISSQQPPILSASTKHDIFVRTGNWGSMTAASSVIKSSANGCSRSRTTKGPLLIFFFWCSSSSSLKGFPCKYSRRHPCVSRRKRLSRAKWRLPWKCRNTSWCPCVSTETFFRHTRH